jgi:hypothetical protein
MATELKTELEATTETSFVRNMLQTLDLPKCPHLLRLYNQKFVCILYFMRIYICLSFQLY